MASSEPTFCESCNRLIIFAATPNRRPMPLDAQPDDTGNVAAYKDDRGHWQARVLKSGQEPKPYEKRYMPHFATCTAPEAHRRRQRGNWTSAQSAHAKERRRRRAGPRQQDILPGIRINPGRQP